MITRSYIVMSRNLFQLNLTLNDNNFFDLHIILKIWYWYIDTYLYCMNANSKKLLINAKKDIVTLPNCLGRRLWLPFTFFLNHMNSNICEQFYLTIHSLQQCKYPIEIMHLHLIWFTLIFEWCTLYILTK